MPRILLAAMLAPTPLPQSRMPRSASPRCSDLAQEASKIRVIIIRVKFMRANVNHSMTVSHEPLPDLVLAGKSVVISTNYNAHQLSPALSYRIRREGCQILFAFPQDNTIGLLRKLSLFRYSDQSGEFEASAQNIRNPNRRHARPITSIAETGA